MEYLVVLGYFAVLLAIANSADDDVSLFLNVSRTRGPRAAPR
jgi:hypothetical protein